MNKEEKKVIEKFIEKCNRYDGSIKIKGVSVGEEYRILETVCKALNLTEKLQKDNEKLNKSNQCYINSIQAITPVLTQGYVLKEEVKQFLEYMQDKVQDCYKEETKIAIQRFLEED